ncbi:MAG TPA: hypothetical protein VEC19_09635 [Usitatibacter sp.]|nr:hypothetical protein [Usitatibacter sp.]
MSRSAKANTIILCLLFGLPFGGIGLFAAWAMATTVHDGWRARDWVKVAAYVEGYDGGDIDYRYSIDGREFRGDRLTVFPLKGDDQVSEALHSRLSEARAARRPITVFVNPQAPAESVVDREVSWQTLVFLAPFAFGFGGVGLGAAWVAARTVRGERPRKAERGLRSDGAGKLLLTWAFTFMWNVIAFPIGIAVSMEAVHNGEWLALLALVFPLIGVLLLFGAIAGTVSYLRRGGAVLELASGAPPRMGSVVQGHMAFPRGVSAGEGFRVKLACYEGKADDGMPKVRWSKHVTGTVAQGPSGARLAFRFQVPARLPGHADEEAAGRTWRIEAERADKLLGVPYGFDLEMLPPSNAALLDPEPAFEDAPFAAAAVAGPQVDFTQGAFAKADLTTAQREVLAGMTPQQRAQVEKLLAMRPLIKKAVIGVVLAIVALTLLPVVIALLMG